MEDGTITLIGATTENPSFQVNTALLSRCRVVVLDKLDNEAILKILIKAVEALQIKVVDGDDDSKDGNSERYNIILIIIQFVLIDFCMTWRLFFSFNCMWSRVYV